MNKVIGGIIAVAIVILGSVFFMGMQTQKKVEGELDQLSSWLQDNVPEVIINNRKYDKGFAGAESSFSIELRGDPKVASSRLFCAVLTQNQVQDDELKKGLQTLLDQGMALLEKNQSCDELKQQPAAADAALLGYIRVNSQIQHGPWTRDGLGLGAADIKISADPQTQKTLAELNVIDLEKTDLRVVLHFGNDVTSRLHMPESVESYENEAVVMRTGDRLYTVNSNAKKKTFSVQSEVSGMEMSSSALFKIRIDKQISDSGAIKWGEGFDKALSAKGKGSIAGMKIDVSGEEVLSCSKVTYENDSSVEKKLFSVDTVMDFNCDATIEQERLNLSGEQTLNFKNIDVIGYAKAILPMVGLDAEEMDYSGMNDTIIFAMLGMLTSAPSLDGTLKMSVNKQPVTQADFLLKIDNVNEADLMLPELLLEKATINVNLSIDGDKLSKTLPPALAKKWEQNIAGAIMFGLLSKDGDQLKFQLKTSKGQFLVNGKPMGF